MNGLDKAVLDAATYGGGPEVQIDIPENAKITPGDGPSIYDGATFTHWTHD